MAAEEQLATPTPAKAPISSHPAFPAIVALWFAALLGLGCLILPGVLFERLVAITGLASIIPAAAPPLGFTARAILALAAAIAGAAIGLVLARKVAQVQTMQPTGRLSGVEQKCRPISAHEELGETPLSPSPEGFGKAAPAAQPVKKRRALAMAEDETKSEYLDTVPVPGTDRNEADEAPETDDASLDLGDFAEPGEDAGQQETAMTDGKISPPTDTTADHGGASAPEQAASEEIAPVENRGDADIEDGADDAGSRNALPFSAPSLKRKLPVLDIKTEEDDEQDGEMPNFSLPRRIRMEETQPETVEPAEPVEEPTPRLSVVESDNSVRADTLDAPADERALDDLGLVQLAARLGASLERRRARRAAKLESAQAPRPVFAETSEDFDAAAADDAARARAEFFGGSDGGHEQRTAAPKEPETAPATEPATRPKFDFIDGQELASSFSLPHGSTQTAAWRQPPAPYDDEDIEDEDGDEYDYSSLLALGNPFERKQPEFVRVDEPEPDEDDIETTVSFPRKKEPETAEQVEPAGTRPFDPPEDSPPPTVPHNSDDADRDLRAALETLQRMSNAG